MRLPTGLVYYRNVVRRGSVSLLVVLALALAWGGTALAQQEAAETTEDAGAVFARAKQLFEANDYRGAIAAFERAYELKPHFMVQCSIARCHELLEDMVRAAEHYRRCLEEGASAAPNAEQVRGTLKEVEGRIAWLAVSSPGKGGTVHVDGREVGPAPARVPLNPGTHTVEVKRPGATDAKASLRLKGGEEQEVSLAPVDPPPPQPPEPPPSPRRRRLSQKWFWIGAGTTAALATVAIVLGVQTLGLQSDYDEHPTKQGLDDFKARRLATNVMWGLTAAAAAGSTVLFFYTDFGGGKRGAADERGLALGVGLRGTF